MSAKRTQRGLSKAADDSLLELARQGNHVAYEELWARYSRLAVHSVYPLAHGEAEDIVSEAFITVWEQLQRGTGPDTNFRGYLIAVARNMCAKNHKDHQRNLTNFDFDSDSERIPRIPAADEISDENHEHQAVLRAFKQLPLRWQQVLWMSEVEGTPRSAIAHKLDLKPNAVSAILLRAREGLRTSWLAGLVSLDRALHPQITDQLPRYIRGTLTPSKSESVEAHLAQCDACTLQLEELQQEDERLNRKRGAVALFVTAVGALGLWLDRAGTSPLAAHANQPPAPANTRFGLIRLPERSKMLIVGSAALLAAGSTTAYLVATNIPPDFKLVADRPVHEESEEPGSPSPELPTGSHPEPGPLELDDEHFEPLPPPEVVADAVSPTDPVPPAELPQVEDPPAELPADNDHVVEPDGQPSQEGFNVEVSGGYGGIVAPWLSGTWSPNTAVEVRVADQSMTTMTDDLGTWSIDLAELGLVAGEYEAVVAVPDQPSSATPVSFALVTPDIEIAARAGQPTDPEGVFPPFTVTFRGVPGATVCPRGPVNAWNPITLDDQGVATSPLFYGWRVSSFGYGYCVGDRLGVAQWEPTLP